MSALAMQRVAEIRRAVPLALASAVELQAARWRLDAYGVPAATTAFACDGWLVLDAPLSGARRASPSRLLAVTSRLDGFVKLVFLGDCGEEGAVRLRAEIAALRDVDLAARLRAAVAAFAAAHAQLELATRQAATAPTARPYGGAPGAPHVPDLAQLCREAGWPFASRNDARLAVELEGGARFRQATVAWCEATGEVRASFDLATSGTGLGLAGESAIEESDGAAAATGEAAASAAGEACREAQALLLLRTAGALRLVRAAASEARGRVVPRLEVVLQGAPSAQEIDCALAALAVAARLCAREAEVLGRDERAARAYLARAGIGAP